MNTAEFGNGNKYIGPLFTANDDNDPSLITGLSIEVGDIVTLKLDDVFVNVLVSETYHRNYKGIIRFFENLKYSVNYVVVGQSVEFQVAHVFDCYK